MKCRYRHCLYDSQDIPPGQEVKTGKISYMHKECARYWKTIGSIVDLYKQRVNKNVLEKTLLATINNIVFKKNVDPEFLLFALKYSLDHGNHLSSPYGLHYIISNESCMTAWKREKALKIIREMKPPEVVKPAEEWHYTPTPMTTLMNLFSENGL